MTDPIPYPPSPNDPLPEGLRVAGLPSPSAPVVSPTGAPMIPPKVVPYLVGVCVAAEVAAQVLPAESVWAKIAHIVAGGCGLLGIASPGLRRK